MFIQAVILIFFISNSEDQVEREQLSQRCVKTCVRITILYSPECKE